MQKAPLEFASKTIAIEKLIRKIYNSANNKDLTNAYLMARLLLDEAQDLEQITWNLLNYDPRND